MTDRELLQIPLPTFDNWASFSVGQLEALLVAWEWVCDQPEWAMWHDGARTFVKQIEAELNRRAHERSRLALQRAIGNWGVAHDRVWGTAATAAATDAVEKLLAAWGRLPPMSAKHWQRLKVLAYATTATGSAMFWVWGLSGIDPGRWLAQGDALIIIVAVVLSQAADVLGDRARHRAQAEEIQRIHPDALGNVACQFNARSPVIRCAVNPAGPCEGCQHYRAKDS